MSRRPPEPPEGGETGPIEGLGALLEPEASELEGLDPAQPPWAAALSQATEPLPFEEARLRARVADSVEAAGPSQEWGRWGAALVITVLVLGVLLPRLLGGLPMGADPVETAPLVPVEQLVLLGPDRVHHLSRATTVVGDAAIRVVERSAEGSVVELDSGRAVFEVVPEAAAGRALRVRAGLVEVVVRGTRFVVERRGEAVEVAVERGLVGVSWPEGEVELGAGEVWTGLAVARVVAPAEQAVVAEVEPGEGTTGSPGLPSAPAEVEPPGVVSEAPGAHPEEGLPGHESAAAEPPGDGLSSDEPPASAHSAEATAAWLAIVRAQDAGAMGETLLPRVDAFLEAHPDSTFAPEAELLRLEIWSKDLDEAAAIAILEQWLDDHPADPRRAQVLLLHGSVAAGRLRDCGRARSTLVELAETGSGDLREAALAYLRACEEASP